ncbi:MAG: hypothetical protein M3406_17380 [Chloroflexota bacterium]|nr:hypothetical protein [Chloroflexota bacterium]
MRQNWLEWVVLGVSVAAVVGLVGFLLVDGITDQGRPPEPRVELMAEAAYEVPGAWIIPATVLNDGDEAAEALALRATATVDGAEEESEVSVDYLAPGTSVDVSFGFSGPPEDEVTVQVVGFRLP